MFDELSFTFATDAAAAAAARALGLEGATPHLSL
jgi:hypothetical protein